MMAERKLTEMKSSNFANETTPLKQIDFDMSVPAIPHVSIPQQGNRSKNKRKALMMFCIVSSIIAIIWVALRSSGSSPRIDEEYLFQSEPFSFLDPRSLGILEIDRPVSSRPGKVFDGLRYMHIPLPTNSWCESLFVGTTSESANNNVFQLPYVIDAAGYIRVRFPSLITFHS